MHKHRNLVGLAVAAACGGPMIAAQAQSGGAGAPGMEELLVYGTQGARESATGSRLGLTVLETPATVDIINGDAIRARIDTSVLEAVTRSAGFTNESNPGNGHSSISARGFDGQGSVTKLYNGTNYYTVAGTVTFPFDTWGVERIEVLKGPSSVLYGEGGIGGAINIIPRRPQYERSSNVRLSLGENDTVFLGVDLTGGLSDSVAYRFDYSNGQSDNWVPDGESEAEMLSLALQWDVTDDLMLSARLDSGRQEPMKYFGVPVVNGDFFGDFTESNFNVGDAEISYDDDSLRLEADWQASDSISLKAEIFQLRTDRFWKNAEYYFYDDEAQLVERYDPLIIGHDMDHTGLRANLLFSPADGRVRASVGFEANDISFERPTNFQTPVNPNGIDFGEFDVVDPYDFQPGTLASLTTAPVALDNMADVSQWALFGEAQFDATDRLAVVAALRYDDYDSTYVRLGRSTVNQTVDALTGRIGLVFDLSDETVLYGQYGTGATHPTGTVVSVGASTHEADLIESEQIEVGIKHQVAGTGFQWNVALFDIVKNNLIADDPDSGNPDDLIFVPEQTSQGIEVGFTYTASSTFQVHGNATVLDAETDTGEKPPTYVPEEMYNLGLVWSVAEQWRILADARYVGERFGSIPIPAHTVVDASARWDVNDRIGLTVKMDNIFDELYATSNYYSDTWIVGKPRTASIVIDYAF
ncbi:MAG TPA: TonB-dependent receptor [Gammaproteobacteria bacterium]|nr:TonB-dependent receptor [Gammaproteobacteria bacterium]